MGAGKSSVGRALGQRLNWIFEDLDDRIEAREGRIGGGDFPRFGRIRISAGRTRCPAASARRSCAAERQNRGFGRRRFCAERKRGRAGGVRAFRQSFWTPRSRNCGSAARAGKEAGPNVRCSAAWMSFASSMRLGATLFESVFADSNRRPPVETIVGRDCGKAGLEKNRGAHRTRRSRVKFEMRNPARRGSGPTSLPLPPCRLRTPPTKKTRRNPPPLQTSTPVRSASSSRASASPPRPSTSSSKTAPASSSRNSRKPPRPIPPARSRIWK